MAFPEVKYSFSVMPVMSIWHQWFGLGYKKCDASGTYPLPIEFVLIAWSTRPIEASSHSSTFNIVTCFRSLGECEDYLLQKSGRCEQQRVRDRGHVSFVIG